MATAWQDQFTELSNINDGNELQNGDDILAEHINTALENGAYVKGLTDELDERVTTLEGKRVTGSFTYSSSSSTIGALIESHPFIRFYYKTTSGSGANLIAYNYNVMYKKTYLNLTDLYQIEFYYESGGTLTAITSGTIYYEYFS